MSAAGSSVQPMKIKYAWRVLRPNGTPSSVIVTLVDVQDSPTVNLIRTAAERHGVVLEPLPIEQVAG